MNATRMITPCAPSARMDFICLFLSRYPIFRIFSFQILNYIILITMLSNHDLYDFIYI